MYTPVRSTECFLAISHPFIFTYYINECVLDTANNSCRNSVMHEVKKSIAEKYKKSSVRYLLHPMFFQQKLFTLMCVLYHLYSLVLQTLFVR